MKLKLNLILFVLITSLDAMTLKEIVKIGLQADPEVLAEISRYEAKKTSVSLAKSGYYPKLNLDAEIGYEESDRDNLHSQQRNTDYTRKEVSVRLRQPIFEGFATSSDVSRSYAEKEAVKYELGTLTENKSLKIIKAYVNVLKSKEIILLAEVNLKIHEEIYESIKKRYEQGVSDKADLIQIKGRVANATTDLISAKNNALDSEAVYIKLINMKPRELEKIFLDEIKIPDTLDEIIREAKKNNPAILTAKKNIDLLKSKKKSTESGYYPHFYGDFFVNYRDDADGIEGRQDKYQAMIKMEWNIFNGFKDTCQNEIVQKEILSSEQKAQNTKRQLILESTLSWNAYTLLKAQLISMREHVKFSKEAKVLYQQQYNVGRRSLIDVLNSQVEAFNASKSFIAAEHDILVAKYRILNSMGTLNKSLGI